MKKSYWIEKVTKEQIELYLGFLRSLTDQERYVYISVEQHGESGKLAPRIGANDVQERKICICGNEPCAYLYSEAVENFVHTIRKRFETLVREHGYGPWGTEIIFGFNGILRDILFKNNGEPMFGEGKQRVTELLVGDLVALESQVRQWLTDNKSGYARMTLARVCISNLWRKIFLKRLAHHFPRKF